MQWLHDATRARPFWRGSTPLRCGGRRSLVATLVAVILLDACYVYRPLATAPEPGENISAELTDRGRVAVADQLGQGILRVEGVLDRSTDEQYVVRVARVAMVDGTVSNWAGERVSIPRAEVARVSERTFSKSRTWLAVGITSVAVGAFAVTRALIGASSGSSGVVRPGGGGSATRIGGVTSMPLQLFEPTFSRSKP